MDTKTSVLIVGGSIVGASAALFLAARGVTPVLVEKHPAISTRLRAKVFYARTMEAYRSVGADKDIYAVQERLPPVDHRAIVTSLAGEELRRWLMPAAADLSDVSPCPGAMVQQADVEQVVREHARAAGADLRFGHRFVDLRQDDDHVVARIVDGDGEPYDIAAGYVLAADGNRSSIREALGIGRSGIDVAASIMEIAFEADLRPILDGRRLAIAQTTDGAFINVTPTHDHGTVSVMYDPTTTIYDAQQCHEIVARALGLPREQVTITGYRPWEMGGWVAEKYRVGRVFLLGDAAHVSPPAGGFGANTGIQDAWNLTAKLVSVLRGDAEPRLLADYETERRPVATMTVEQALLRLREDDELQLSEAAISLGYRYQLTDKGLPVVDEPDRWHGEVGTRLPHMRLDGGSTLDLVRDGRYLLLTGADGQPWANAVQRLDMAQLPRGAGEAFGIGDDGVLLVRPDHVIAWRANHAVQIEALEKVARQASLAGI